MTRNYSILQGLKVIPMGVGFLVLGALQVARAGLPPDPRLGRIASVALLVVVVLGYFLAARNYHRVFGRVRQTGANRRRTIRFVLLNVGVAIASMLILTKLRVGYWSTSWFTLSVLSLLYWRWTEGWLPQWAWLAALTAVLGVLELLPGAPLDRGMLWLMPSLGARSPVIRQCFGFGTICIVLGLLDHRMLRDALRGTVNEARSEVA